MSAVERCTRCLAPTVVPPVPEQYADDDRPLLCARCVIEAVGLRSVFVLLETIVQREPLP